MCIYDDGNSVFRGKNTTIFCNAKFGDFGLMETVGQNMSSKVLYLEFPTLICLFTMQLLWGYDDE